MKKPSWRDLYFIVEAQIATISRLRKLLEEIHSGGAFLILQNHPDADRLLSEIRKELPPKEPQ